MIGRTNGNKKPLSSLVAEATLPIGAVLLITLVWSDYLVNK